MTEKERMLAGKLYNSMDPELRADVLRSRQLIQSFNSATFEQQDYRRELLKQILGGTGERFYIEPPFHCDYGGNIYIGENFYANFDCIILDVARVFIGDNCFFGPKVSIYTPVHPYTPEIRNSGLELGREVHIGNNVWLGGGVTVNPGVTIGDNTIIGSGSVVTRDIPANVIAAGSPCRVIREINDKDKAYWEKQLEEYRNS